MLNILKSANKSKDNVAGIAHKDIIQNKKALALTLVNLNLSTKIAHDTSKILIPEVTEAQNNNIKNKLEIASP